MCNLTKAFSSRSQTYYNRVFAVSGNEVSPPGNQIGFKPIDGSECQRFLSHAEKESRPVLIRVVGEEGAGNGVCRVNVIILWSCVQER